MQLSTRIFKLSNEPGSLGLSCTEKGLDLAGVPLLARTEHGFSPRSADEIRWLIGQPLPPVPVIIWYERDPATPRKMTPVKPVFPFTWRPGQ